MATYRRRGRTGIAATQFREPNLAPPPPPEISASWSYTDKGVSVRIKDDWWIVPNEDPEQPASVLNEQDFAARYEEE